MTPGMSEITTTTDPNQQADPNAELRKKMVQQMAMQMSGGQQQQQGPAGGIGKIIQALMMSKMGQ